MPSPSNIPNWRQELEPDELCEPRPGQRCRVRRISTMRTIVFEGTVSARSTFLVTVAAEDGRVRTFPLIGYRLD